MGYIEGALALAGLLVVGGLAIWLVNLGKKVERSVLLEDDIEAHNEGHKQAEKWHRAGGLGAALLRARKLRKSETDRDLPKG